MDIINQGIYQSNNKNQASKLCIHEESIIKESKVRTLITRQAFP